MPKPLGLSKTLATALAYLALAVLLNASWLFDGDFGDYAPPGAWTHDALLNAFLAARNFPALLHGGLDAMLQTGTFYPYRDTLLLTEPMLGWSVLAWPLIESGLTPLGAHNVLWLLAIALNGTAVFCLARYVCRNDCAAFLAGIPAAFSAHAWYEGPRLQIVFVGAVAGCLLLLELLMRERRAKHAVGLAVFVVLQLLLGLYQSLFLVTTIVLWLASRPLAYGWRNAFPRGRLVRIAAALLVPLVLAAPFLHRYLEAREAFGSTRSREYVVKTAPPAANFLCVQPPSSRLWGPILPCNKFPAIEPHFVGVVVTTLFLVAVALSIRRRGEAFERHYLFLVLALVAIMLGPRIHLGEHVALSGPYELLYRYVPGWKGVRFPGRIGGITEVCIGVLVASAATTIANALDARRRHLGSAAVILLTVLALVEVVPMSIRYDRSARIDPSPAYARFLKDVPGDGAVVELPSKLAEPPDAWRDGTALLASLTHERPIVNGILGFDPEEHVRTVKLLDRFPRAEALSEARRIGVRFVVMRSAPFFVSRPSTPADAMAQETRRLVRERGAGFRLVTMFPDDGVEIYELVP